MWRNGGMEFLAGGNGRNPEKNIARLSFINHEIYMGVIETRSRVPSERGERLTQGSSTRGPGRVFQKIECVMNIKA